MIAINKINKKTLRIEDVNYLYSLGHIVTCEDGRVTNINQFGGFQANCLNCNKPLLDDGNYYPLFDSEMHIECVGREMHDF